MFGQLIDNVLVLGGIYTAMDILGKFNTGKIKSTDDLQRDLVGKGLYLLKVYTDTTILVENVYFKVKEYLNIENSNDSDFEDSEDEDEKECRLKIDLYNSSEYELVKSIVDYEIGDEDKIVDCDITELDKEDIENSDIKFAYDYFTKTYLQLSEFDKDSLLKNTQAIVEEFENSLYDTKLFINIELLNGDKKIDLLKYVNKYFRSGNNILSKEFIEYIIVDNDLMIDLEDNYTVNLMDKNINMINIDNNSSVNITTKEVEESSNILEYNIINKKN
jgi:hypothetical protein